MDQKVLANRPGLDFTGFDRVSDSLRCHAALLGHLSHGAPFLQRICFRHPPTPHSSTLHTQSILSCMEVGSSKELLMEFCLAATVFDDLLGNHFYSKPNKRGDN